MISWKKAVATNTKYLALGVSLLCFLLQSGTSATLDFACGGVDPTWTDTQGGEYPEYICWSDMTDSPPACDCCNNRNANLQDNNPPPGAIPPTPQAPVSTF